MESEHPQIAIVEDDEPTRRFLADNLAADGFEPLEASTARDGLRLFADHAPALAVLDLGLPDGDGLEVLHDVRAGEISVSHIDPALPVLVLSGRGAELDRVRGFERGADDYLVKPFSYLELRGRIDALLRRSRHRPGAGRLKVGPLELDPATRHVALQGQALAVSKKEFALLRTLASEPVRVFTREELLRGVWGYKSVVPTRTLDSHASRLRRKLSDAGAPGLIVNVWGVGYRLLDAWPMP
ncbi:MAG TPA: response regulator transcription factor [Solirubrobacteraceae bacterium]|nr:response regulator transcription factor [Solirubrobacteraceae bacterium]